MWAPFKISERSFIGSIYWMDPLGLPSSRSASQHSQTVGSRDYTAGNIRGDSYFKKHWLQSCVS